MKKKNLSLIQWPTLVYFSFLISADEEDSRKESAVEGEDGKYYNTQVMQRKAWSMCKAWKYDIR